MEIKTEFEISSINDMDNDHVSQPTCLHNCINNNSHLHMNNRINHRRPSGQTSLFEYLPSQFQDRYGNETEENKNQPWGQNYNVKSANTVRIWYTNPNGLGINPTDSKSHSTFAFLYHKSMADIICLAETNLNWHILQYNSRLNNRLRAYYREFYSTTSNNKHEKHTKNQRGGTCTFAVGQITYRIRTSGNDTTGMGRWSWIQIDGKDNHRTRVITAYRPCRAPKNSGLTTTWDQQCRYLRKQNLPSDPRQQFDLDLSKLLSSWQNEGIKIILSIDANDNILEGKFNDLIDELGLINIHKEYGQDPLPPTHDRGSTPISGMYSSPALIPSRIGILAHGSGILGDHRNMYVDFPEETIMGNEIFIIPPPQQRRLQLFDSRVVQRFNKICLSHLEANKVDIKTQKLLETSTFPPAANVQSQMENIDEQLGRAIQSAEKNCRKLRCGNIPFSEAYRKVRDKRRFWILLLRRKYGRRVSSTTIRRLAQRLKVNSPMSITFNEAKYQFKLAKQQYFDFIRNASTERESFIDQLADANAKNQNLPKYKVLRRIKHDEEQRVYNSKMKTVYKKSKFQRLDRVVIIHNGHPVEISEPHRVAAELRKMNNDKYSSTNDTPLMHEPYVSSIGYLAENEGATMILNGTFGFQPNTHPIEHDLLRRLQKPDNAPIVPTQVTPEEYRTAWRAVKERKSSSMSGRHFGVYKAAVTNDKLLPIFTGAFNLPFRTGIPYDRWSNFLNVMTPKIENNYNVDKLRSLILGEADWNMGGRIFINRTMLSGAEKLQLIPREHYGGRKGHKATDAVLNKRLALDNIRLSKKPAAIISTDAANCYDRMVHSFISLCVQRLGVSMSLVFALLRPLQESRHFVRTAYGDSTTFYGGKRDVPFQGSGQGNCSSSPFWTVVSSHLIEMMREMEVCSTFTTSITLATFALIMIMYVDDNDIFINSTHVNQIDDIKTKSQQAITFWKDALHVTGGVVRPSKCSWVLVDFAWNGAEYRYKMKRDTPGDIYLSDDNGNNIPLQRNNPNVALEGLGVFLQPEGNDNDQFDYMIESINKWKKQLQKSNLPPSYNFNALHTRIIRTLFYPLPTTCLTIDQCQRLEAEIYRFSLPKCGVSAKLPLIMRYGPKQYMGLSIPEFHIQQGIAHIRELITSFDTNNTTAQHFQLSIETIHLLIGTQQWVFDQHYDDIYEMIDNSWMRTTWSFLQSHRFTIKAPGISFNLPRSNDCFIMDRVNLLPIPKMDKIRINKCRIYIQALTLSDIVDAGGTKLMEKAMRGQKDDNRKSRLNWPNQGRPCESDWALWRYHITRTFSRPRSRQLLQPLGHWISSSHQEWTWFYDNVTHTVYHKQNNLYVQYDPERPIGIITRSGHRRYKRIGIIIGSVNCNLLRCTVTQSTRDRITLQNVSRQHDENLQPFSFLKTPSPPTIEPYYHFRHFSDLDNGETMSRKLSESSSIIVGDGSYERRDDTSASAFIWETGDTTSRITNATMVPMNPPTIYRFWSDPYRCELFSILLALMSVLDMERRFHNDFCPITIAVDNDSALDMAIVFDGLVPPTNQHYDIISSIREVRHRLRTKLQYSRVRGHCDDDTPFQQLSKMEQLNVECDLLAKHARIHMKNHAHLMPSLSLPFERIALYHNNIKIYKNFNSIVTDKCYIPRARQYYCRKYTWDEETFQSINWDAIEGAMARCTPSTAKWVTKFSSGFIGTAKTLARRDYWLDGKCPMCQCNTEDNTHVILCSQPAQRQILLRQLDELYDWMEYVRFSPMLISEIKRINTLWINDPSLTDVTSPSQEIQHQIRIGWKHLFYGRTHNDITSNLHNHYTNLGFRRHAQSTMSKFIYKIWTVVIRPLWNSRNRKVHALQATTSLSRIQQDLRLEITEIYNNTNIDMLFHRDRQLFETPLEDLLKKHDSYLYSWRDEVDIATKHASSSATINDPTQRTILFHPPQDIQNNPSPDQTITTAQETDMTPVQRRIHRRRKTIPNIHTPSISQRSTSPERNTSPPLPVPLPVQPNVSNPPPTRHPQPTRRRRRSNHITSDQPRVTRTATNDHVNAPPSIPTHSGTLHHYWSRERERRRLLQGSWRPP